MRLFAPIGEGRSLALFAAVIAEKTRGRTKEVATALGRSGDAYQGRAALVAVRRSKQNRKK